MQTKSRISRPTLRDTIESTENNYTLLRLLLAASVIYYHSFGLTRADGFIDYATSMFSPVTTTGGLAVQAFFFLSGLFVAQSFFRDQNTLSFVVKRALRIWPGFFICLVVTSFLSVAVSRPMDLHHYLLFDGLYEYILRNAIFDLNWTINGVFMDHPHQSINGPIHTLPLEAKMYVVLAVVGLLGLVKTTRRIAVVGCLLVAAALIPGTVEALPFALFDMGWSKAAGIMFLAGVATFGLAQYIRPAPWQGAAALVMVLASQGSVHVMAFYVLVIWCLLWLGQLPALSRFRVQQDLSYGIYLYGWPLQQMVVEFFPDLNPYALSLAALGGATALAWLSWTLIEKHAITLGKYLGRVKFMVWEAPMPRRAAASMATIGMVLMSSMAILAISHSTDLVPVVAMPAAILDFGPKESPAGQRINKQPDGSSAVWIVYSGVPPADLVVVFNGARLPTQVGEKLITATVPKAQLKDPGARLIHLEYRTVHEIQRSNTVRMMLQ